MIGFNEFFHFLRTIPWFAWIPILGVIGWMITSVVQMQHRHRERMEKIRHGIDPDAGGPDSHGGER